MGILGYGYKALKEGIKTIKSVKPKVPTKHERTLINIRDTFRKDAAQIKKSSDMSSVEGAQFLKKIGKKWDKQNTAIDKKTAAIRKDIEKKKK